MKEQKEQWIPSDAIGSFNSTYIKSSAYPAEGPCIQRYPTIQDIVNAHIQFHTDCERASESNEVLQDMLSTASPEVQRQYADYVKVWNKIFKPFK